MPSQTFAFELGSADASVRTSNSALDPTARGASGVHFERRVTTPRTAGHRGRWTDRPKYHNNDGPPDRHRLR